MLSYVVFLWFFSMELLGMRLEAMSVLLFDAAELREFALS